MHFLVLALAALTAPQGGRHAVPELAFASAAVEQGGVVDLELSFKVDAGWHIYHPDYTGPGVVPSVTLSGAGFELDGPLRSLQEGKSHVITVGQEKLTELWLEGDVRLLQSVRVTAPAGAASLTATVSWMECDVRMCLPPTRKEFPLSIQVTAAAGSLESAAQEGIEPELSGKVKVEWDFTKEWSKGKTYDLDFTLNVVPGFHVYHPDQDPDNGLPVSVDFLGQGFEVLGPAVTKTKPTPHHDAGADYLWLEGKVNFSVPVKVTGDPALAGGFLRIRWAACNDSFCLPTEGVYFPVGTPGNGAAAGVGDAGSGAGSVGGGLGDAGFLKFLWLAVIAGLFTLLTPCVFPMIPVTISYFTKRADEGKGTPLGNASAYAAGIVFTFAGIGVAAALAIGPTGANAIGSNPWVNLGIAALFVWMALSLLGFYDIQAPRFLQNFASKTQADGRSRGGYLPVVLMAIAFSITAFTCTVGFVGVVFATGLQLGLLYLVGGMLVYGLVFALPFFFLALFPSYLKTLPQAGGWMNAIKVSAGFIELVAAVKFFSNTDLTWHARVFTWPMAVGLWIVFFVLWAAYMFGLYRTHHDYDKSKRTVGRTATGVLALALAAFLLPGMWNRSETAYAGGWAEAYLPPAEYGIEEIAADGGVIKAGGLSWQENYGHAYEIATAEGIPLFVDFTGVTCVNCRKMEYDIFPQPEVKALLAGMARAELWVDKAPYGSWNADFEVERFGAAAQPYYAVIDPRDDAVLEVKADGYDPDPAVFVAFLTKARDAYASRTPGPLPEGGAWHERKPILVVEGWQLPPRFTPILQGLVLASVIILVLALFRVEFLKRREEKGLLA
jgi:thiol:disulfide interchange protein DsbD